MLRSVPLVLAGILLVLVLGCANGRKTQSEIANLQSKLAQCRQENSDYQVQLEELERSYSVNAQALDEAQQRLNSLTQLQQQLHETVTERERKLAELKDLVKNVTGVQVESRREGDFIVIENKILFASGEAQLTDQARRTLGASVVGYLKKHLQTHRDQEIRIDGHTDGVPITHSDWESNYHLAARRAHAVMSYLVAQGIPAKNTYIVGFGPNRPRKEPPAPQADVPENRRVEILLVPEASLSVEELLKGFAR